jgi:hypothetical protein
MVSLSLPLLPSKNVSFGALVASGPLREPHQEKAFSIQDIARDRPRFAAQE